MVAIEPVAIIPGHTVRVRPDTSFLTQLLATDSHEPQTRKFRQADPAIGAAQYAAAPSPSAPWQPQSPRYSQIV
ncbi:MAG: hypothetical protein K2W78_09535 [Xanthobacteraceae bacterium]|nr:hypothetical protein [Xanthobacteraceae bacterium]